LPLLSKTNSFWFKISLKGKNKLKVLILAGGSGSRIGEETELRPKPMIEIGGMPILWHIMKLYSHYGFNEFVILLGYKGYVIKEYFANYFIHQSDITIDLQNNDLQIHKTKTEPWKITLVDTGKDTATGGRIKRAREYTENKPFMMTYGDGVGNIDINQLIKFHNEHKKVATLTAVQPIGRFGAINFSDNDILSDFEEKPKGDGAWINGGFFVFEPSIFDYITGDEIALEGSPLKTLAKKGQMMAYKHNGFWRPMDTMRDKNDLERLWINGNPPWKLWN
jgi:glucose-1-phosphate cytidylyltransferase